jgi:hypothetical protein
MLVNQKELLSPPGMRSSGPGVKSVRIPVAWSTVSFECSIRIRAAGAKIDPGGSGPVRLRVREAVADCSKFELFCAEAGLCGISAGD